MLSFTVNEHFRRVKRAECRMEDDAHGITGRYQHCKSVVDVTVRLVV